MPVDIIIYAALAAVMVFWLKNVIGTRHGEERERPNPFDETNTSTPTPTNTDIKPSVKTSDYTKSHSKSSSVDSGLVQIALTDKAFDTNQFKENASDAFSIIVTAFAEGDMETLQDMCTDTVYKTFASDIENRKETGETISNEIHAIRKVEITDATIRDKHHAEITIRFTADETYVISDKAGNVIAGHPDRVTEMIDKWTFTRNTKSSDPRWFLSKVDDDVIESDGKTPIPDAG